MKNYSKLLTLVILCIGAQSCATLHCDRLVGKEKQACITQAQNTGLWHTMMGAQQGATDAGNAVATHMMMTPPMMP